MATTFISYSCLCGGSNSMKIASWSKKYYEGLTEAQHKANDDWFESKRKLLNYTGVLIVPNLQKSFNRHGEEINLGLPPTDEPTPIREDE